jgi:hypothetical protein
MATILLFAVTFLLISSRALVSALPNITVIPISAGDCTGFPSSYDTGGTHSDQEDQADNSSINGLPTGTTNANLVVYEDSTIASYIFCCNFGAVLDDLGFQELLISTNSTDEDLGYLGQGSKPEMYAHELNGVRQDGVFLGIANVTTWAFRRVANLGYYEVRLFGLGANLKDGEFKGFLKTVLPPGTVPLLPPAA